MVVDIRYYLSIFWRRLPILLPISLVLSAASVFYALSLPPRYESNAILLLESAQIDNSLLTATVRVTPQEQLQIVQQRLMTRANLLDIARKYNVYEDMNLMTADAIVTNMRTDASIAVRSGRNQATLMTIGFVSSNPQVAAAVLNDFVTLVLDENSEFRKSRAAGTTEFFEQEVERLNRELDVQSSRIMEFQSRNSEALPSTLTYRLNREGQLQETLNLNERERLALLEQKTRATQLYEITGQARQQTPEISPLQAELERLRGELSNALLVYSEENPRVKIMQSRVEALEIQVEEEKLANGTPVDPGKALLEVQLNEIDTRVESLTAENDTLRKEIEALRETIDVTPQNEIALEALEREFDILKSQYNAAVSRLSTAATGERVEFLSKGERISVVEQPTVPDEPTKPNRELIAGAGSLLGFGFAAGVVVLFELLNRSIRRPVDISNKFGIMPIGVIPVIRTPGDRMFKGTLLVSAVAIVVVGVPAALLAVHTYYLPLDLLADRAMARLGI